MSEADSVLVERDGPITIVSINRPHCRNAVDGATARKLHDAFLAFEADTDASVAVFTGTGGYFCAGADLKAVASGDPNKKREVGGHNSIAPMGPSRLRLRRPPCCPLTAHLTTPVIGNQFESQQPAGLPGALSRSALRPMLAEPPLWRMSFFHQRPGERHA